MHFTFDCYYYYAAKYALITSSIDGESKTESKEDKEPEICWYLQITDVIVSIVDILILPLFLCRAEASEAQGSKKLSRKEQKKQKNEKQKEESAAVVAEEVEPAVSIPVPDETKKDIVDTVE